MCACSRRGGSIWTRRREPFCAATVGRSLPETRCRPAAISTRPICSRSRKPPSLQSVIETGVRVRSVSRRGIDKLVTRGRSDHPFRLAVEPANGSSRIDLARAVIDASGTWATSQPARRFRHSGARRGEKFRSYRLWNSRRARGGPRRIMPGVACWSSAAVIRRRTRCSTSRGWLNSDQATRLTWALRNTSPARVFGGARADKLAARGKLGEDLKRLVESGRLQLVTGFRTERVEEDGGALIVSGIGPAGPVALAPADRIIVATGQRPDLALTRELRLDLDPWLECPRALGPMIDPNLHSCGTVPPHGIQAARASGAGLFRGRHQELRARADLPDGDRLRAGPLGRGASGGRRGGSRRRPSRASGDRRLLDQSSRQSETQKPPAAAAPLRSRPMRAAPTTRQPRPAAATAAAADRHGSR